MNTDACDTFQSSVCKNVERLESLSVFWSVSAAGRSPALGSLRFLPEKGQLAEQSNRWRTSCSVNSDLLVDSGGTGTEHLKLQRQELQCDPHLPEQLRGPGRSERNPSHDPATAAGSTHFRQEASHR